MGEKIRKILKTEVCLGSWKFKTETSTD